ncbi:response regulator, partial [Arthrospira platensis SPKY1]|nr:response regulator [Arthrospira platensis SPKY1]
EDARSLFEREAFHLVVLDWMLPDGDGLQWLQKIRKRGSRTPVIMLTARGQIDDRVQGLDAGADDYLVKPFALAELLARMRTLLRRSQTANTKELKLGTLRLDLLARKVIDADHGT